MVKKIKRALETTNNTGYVEWKQELVGQSAVNGDCS